MQDLAKRLRDANIKLFSISAPECEGMPWRCHARRDAGFAYGMPAATLQEAAQSAIAAFIESNKFTPPTKKSASKAKLPSVDAEDVDLADLLG